MLWFKFLNLDADWGNFEAMMGIGSEPVKEVKQAKKKAQPKAEPKKEEHKAAAVEPVKAGEEKKTSKPAKVDKKNKKQAAAKKTEEVKEAPTTAKKGKTHILLLYRSYFSYLPDLTFE
jgi:hypothetical protein